MLIFLYQPFLRSNFRLPHESMRMAKIEALHDTIYRPGYLGRIRVSSIDYRHW